MNTSKQWVIVMQRTTTKASMQRHYVPVQKDKYIYLNAEMINVYNVYFNVSSIDRLKQL